MLVCRDAQLCEASELLIVCFGERSLKFTGFGLGVWLCHYWPDVLGEFVVCV